MYVNLELETIAYRNANLVFTGAASLYSRLVRMPKWRWAWQTVAPWCHPPMIPPLARSTGDSS